ncbi:MAG: SCO family protein [Pseudomonadota bacterium]
MRARHLFWIALAGVAAACGGQSSDAPLPTEGVIALSNQFTGDFALVNKDGAPQTDEDFEGRVMLVYFGFTHCPDVCPGDVNVMSAALNELGSDAGEVAPVFISVDPERDTPEALTDYFAFDERIIPLTGSLEASAEARQAFKLIAEKEPLPDSALKYTVNHGRFFYITDRFGQPEYAVVGGVSPQELAALLRRNIDA